ncbi:MAG: outer membrane beta-barrel protein [Gammaproteobacteria bacterium]
MTTDALALEQIRGGTIEARDAHVAVDEQPRGDGVTLGGVRLQPTVPVGVRYDDEVFASDDRSGDDFAFSLFPSIVAAHESTRSSFVTKAYVRSDFYADRQRLDNTEVGVGIAGRFELLDWLEFSLHGSYDDLHEDFDSPDVPLDASEQVELDQLSGGAGLLFTAGRFSAAADFTYLEVNVDDVTAVDGRTIDLIGRNRDTVDVTVELGWQLRETLRPYLSYRWNDHGYDQAPPRVLVDRDGAGHAIVGGVEWSAAQASARAFVGHVRQNFRDDDLNLEEADGVGYGAEIEWQVTAATRLRVDGLREIEEASEGFESGRFATTWRLGAEHRVSDRFSVDGVLGYIEREYVGTAREADTWSGRLGVTWQLPGDFYSRAAWRYSERDSNAPGRSYSRNQAWLWLGWRR